MILTFPATAVEIRLWWRIQHTFPPGAALNRGVLLPDEIRLLQENNDLKKHVLLFIRRNGFQCFKALFSAYSFVFIAAQNWQIGRR